MHARVAHLQITLPRVRVLWSPGRWRHVERRPALAPPAASHPQQAQCAHRVSIIEPVPDSTKLRVSDAGLQLLRGMAGHLAPVVVIGPYRSGKSFLINQMLDIPCGAAPSAACAPTVNSVAHSLRSRIKMCDKAARFGLAFDNSSAQRRTAASKPTSCSHTIGSPLRRLDSVALCRCRHASRSPAHDADAGRLALE